MLFLFYFFCLFYFQKFFEKKILFWSRCLSPTFRLQRPRQDALNPERKTTSGTAKSLSLWFVVSFVLTMFLFLIQLSFVCVTELICRLFFLFCFCFCFCLFYFILNLYFFCSSFSSLLFSSLLLFSLLSCLWSASASQWEDEDAAPRARTVSRDEAAAPLAPQVTHTLSLSSPKQNKTQKVFLFVLFCFVVCFFKNFFSCFFFRFWQKSLVLFLAFLCFDYVSLFVDILF